MNPQPQRTSHFQYLFAIFWFLTSIALAVEPTVHWRMENNGQDAMGYQDLLELQNITFSTDCIEGSYSMSFDKSQKALAIVSKSLTNRAEIKKSFFHQKYQERTFSLWFKTTDQEISPNPIQYLLKLGGNVNCVNISLNDDKVVAFIGIRMPIEENRDFISLQGPYLPLQWNHVVFRFKNGQGALFINGKKVAQDAFRKNDAWVQAGKGGALGGINDVFYDNHNEVVGDEPLPKFFFNGLIDDVQLFAEALSNKGVYKLYQRTRLTHTGQDAIANTQHSPSIQMDTPVAKEVKTVEFPTIEEAQISPLFKTDPQTSSNIETVPNKQFSKIIVIGLFFFISGLMIVATTLILYKKSG